MCHGRGSEQMPACGAGTHRTEQVISAFFGEVCLVSGTTGHTGILGYCRMISTEESLSPVATLLLIKTTQELSCGTQWQTDCCGKKIMENQHFRPG